MVNATTSESLIRPALVVFIALSAITGIVYPLAVTGIAQFAFPAQANGSLITKDGKVVGSSLIGQEFAASGDPKYFWGRPSATGPVPYASFNADKSTGSSGSNLGPTNPELVDNVKARCNALKAADAAAGYQRRADQKIPIDLVTSSASGLDPHISLAAAEYQLPRVAKARGVDEAKIRAIVESNSHGRQWGVLGEPCVNVLELNLALDAMGR
jgi:K+-transporting ATPase ATPase C chain